MANTSDLTKELEGFFISLGFEVNGTHDVKAMAETVTETVGIMRRLVLGAHAAAGAVALFVAHSAAGADELNDFANANDVSVEAVQELGFAAANSGSSVDALKASIASVNIVLGEASIGVGRGVQTLQKLGISARNEAGNVKSFDEVLSEVADRMAGLSLPEATAFANRIGIDPSLVPMLRQGSDAIEELRLEARQLGIVNKDQIEQGAELAGSIRRTLFFVSAIKNEVALGLYPAAKELVDGFREWVLVNREMIRSGITFFVKLLSGAVGTLWQWISGLVSSLIDVVKWFGQFKLAVIAAMAAMTIFISIGTARVFGTIAIAVWSSVQALLAFNAAALMTPALIGAIILAVGLLIEDFIVWKEGGDSLLEEVFGKFPDAVQKVKDFFGPLQTVINFFSNLYDAAARFGSYIKDTLFGTIDMLWEKFKNMTGFSGFSFSPTASVTGEPSALTGGGLMGTAAQSINNATATTTNATTIQELNISVNSPDPRTAGESVVAELDRRGMIMTRNAQSRVVS